MKRFLLHFLMLMCIIWHWEYCSDMNALKVRLVKIRSTAQDIKITQVWDEGFKTAVPMGFLVLWSEKCNVEPTPTPRPRPSPTPTLDWRKCPTKYRTPNPIWKPGDPR